MDLPSEIFSGYVFLNTAVSIFETPRRANISTDAAIKRIFDDWHRATVSGDLDVLAGLYATDAVFESPTAILMLGQSKGIVKGRARFEPFFRRFIARSVEVQTNGIVPAHISLTFISLFGNTQEKHRMEIKPISWK